jgi:hypothetical protein
MDYSTSNHIEHLKFCIQHNATQTQAREHLVLWLGVHGHTANALIRSAGIEFPSK